MDYTLADGALGLETAYDLLLTKTLLLVSDGCSHSAPSLDEPGNSG